MHEPIRTVDLRSDTFTLPTKAMRTAMAEAEVGDDVYGEDPTVHALEHRVATLLGKEAACFVPSGTMANLASIMAHCARGAKVIVGEESDIHVYEAGGASVCGGVVYHPVANQADGSMAIADLAAALHHDADDPQFARPALICVENPQNRCGGRILRLEYLAEVARLAHEHAVAVHLDGARLFNAVVASGVPANEICRHVDSAQVCLSKGLGAPVGSVIVGGEAFVRSARRVRKLLGGGMRQAGVLAAAGLVALDQLTDRLTEDHANARRLSDRLTKLPGIDVMPGEPETNMVFFRVTQNGLTTEEFIAGAETFGVRVAELGHGRVRAVTHGGITATDIDHAAEVFATVIGIRPRA